MNSHLSVKTKFNNNKTVYDDVYFTPPYKIIAPLYNDKEAEIMILSSSAGLLKNDKIQMDFHFTEHSNVKISSQSYEKVFDTQDGFVEKNTSIIVEENARVLYMPHPTIPFKNSNYMSRVNANISSKSTFFYSDIFTCGRVFMNEKFLMNQFHSCVKICVDSQLVFADNTLINPKVWNYNSLGLWHGYTHNGLLYAYFPNLEKEKEFIEFARRKAEEIIPLFEYGVSQSRKGLCVRILGDNGDKIYNFFKLLSCF